MSQLSSVTPDRFYLFSYKAFQCLADLACHLEGIAIDGEVLVHLHGAEVRAQRAVVLAGDGDVLAAEEAGVALACPGQRLDEGVVRVAVEVVVDVALAIAAQHARIVLARLHRAVGAQDGLQVHAQFGVGVPTLLIINYYCPLNLDIFAHVCA